MTTLQNAIEDSIATLKTLSTLQPEVDQAVKLIATAFQSGGQLLACGNGGSAADSAHLTSELVGRYVADRRPYPAINLTCEGSALTSIGNDYSFDDIFARQVRGFGRKSDILVVFTSSGNSRNIANAIEDANRLGMHTIAFLGRDGGFTRELATVNLLVPGDVTARIQEAHGLLIHAICEMLDEKLGTGD